MLNTIARILKAEKGEETPVLLLFGQGFFMGIYLYSYKIVAEAIFLSRLEHYLAEAMFASAVLGVLSAGLFSYLQSRISFSKLTIINLFIVFVFLGSLRFLYDYLDEKSLNILVFSSFIMIQPVMSVALLNFWGIFGRIFDLRQSKRIIGGIDSGQLLAAFITSLSIPFFAKVFIEIDFLYISLIAIFLNLGLLIIIISKYDLEKHRGGSGQKVKTRISGILKEKYVVYLSLFLILSIVSFQFVHYSYLSVTKIYYPSETQLVTFLGFFNASIMVCSLILQTFVNERLIATYGLKTTLLVLPVVLIVFTVVSILIGQFFGYTALSPTFFWFFLFIVLSKLFSESLRESLETPSFKLFFMPLDIKIRFDIQAKVEGVINEFSRLIAGIAILALGFLSFFQLIHYSIILVFVIVAWMWSTSKLYAEYRNNVKRKLQGNKADYEVKQKRHRRIKHLVDELEKDGDSLNFVFALKLLEKWDVDLFKAHINKLITSSKKQIRRFALDKMNELRTNTPVNNRVFKLEQNNRGNFSLAQWFDSMGSGKSIDHAELSKLLASVNHEDRKYLATMLGRKANLHGSHMLMELVDDPDVGVKGAALSSVAAIRLKEAFPVLIAELKSSIFTDKAAKALVEIGEEVFPELETAFYKSGQNIKIMLKVLQIYGRAGGAKAIGLLWDKIDYPDKKIIAQVLLSLGECDFLADESQVTRIKFAIDGDIANISRNLKVLESIPEGTGAELLKGALEYDIHASVKHIFMLLSMLYDSHSIQLVQENLFEKSGEGLTYAIELLDVFLSDDLKEKIIFMLDDVLESKQLNKLQNYYPQNELKFADALRMVINRDFNQNNRWTKACAIRYIGENAVPGYEMDLLASMFNPDPLIREISAWSINQLNPALYRSHIHRLDMGSRKELETMVENGAKVKTKKMLRFEKILLLSDIEVFKYIPGFILSNVVEMSQEVDLRKGDEITLSNGNTEFAYALVRGHISLVGETTASPREHGRKLLGGRLELGDLLAIKALTDAVLIKIDKGKFYDYLSGNLELALHVLDNMVKNDRNKTEKEETIFV